MRVSEIAATLLLQPYSLLGNYVPTGLSSLFNTQIRQPLNRYFGQRY